VARVHRAVVGPARPRPARPARAAPRARGGDPVTDKRSSSSIATAMGVPSGGLTRRRGARMLVGARIPEGSGAKDEPLALGAATVVLGVIAPIRARVALATLLLTRIPHHDRRSGPT
jgi:hypothetical protein